MQQEGQTLVIKGSVVLTMEDGMTHMHVSRRRTKKHLHDLRVGMGLRGKFDGAESTLERAGRQQVISGKLHGRPHPRSEFGRPQRPRADESLETAS